MNDNYAYTYQQALNGQAMFFGMLDDSRKPYAALIAREVQNVSDYLRDHRHPRSVEDRIKQLQRHLLQSRQSGHAVMRVHETITLHDHYERLRRDLRKLPNY